MDKNQLKTQGLAFGLALQRAYKNVLLYSTEHAGVQQALQQAYDSLSAVLKLTPQFTFGFFNQRVLLNDLLTTENALSTLQAEFSKRNIAAASFFSGIGFREFQRGVSLLTAKPESIEQAGGIHSFLKKNPVEGMRLLAEEKRPSAKEDTVLGMDLRSYLVAQSIMEGQPGARVVPSLEMLLQTAGMERPAAFGGTAGEILELASRATQAAWSDPESNPQDVIPALARLLEELTPDYFISALAPAQQSKFRGLPAQEIAAELAEDMAIEWAGRRLSAVPTDAGGAAAVEADVARVLARALQTTQVAQRFLQKLGRLAEEAKLPPELLDRVQQELMWSSLSKEEQYARLRALDSFTERDFRHLLEYVEETGKEGNVDQALQVAEHYLAWADSGPAAARLVGLGRLPELLDTFRLIHTLAFARLVAERLCQELQEEPLDWPCHREVAGVLASTANCAALFEDFETTLKIGLSLKGMQERDSVQHADCCGNALQRLLPPLSIERLLQLSLQKSSDLSQSRAVASLLRLGGLESAEAVFQFLEKETEATTRARLLRIAGQLGPSALQAARKRLLDERWYVIRNACNILSALDDPGLASQLSPALRHADVRVQQAAVTAILRSKVPHRGEALARALPYLQPHLQETVLNELILLKDPAAIAPLEDFIFQGSTSKTGILEQAIKVLTNIPDELIVGVLSKILYDAKQPVPLRKAAMVALKISSFSLAQQCLAEFSSRMPGDPLAAEYRSTNTPNVN